MARRSVERALKKQALQLESRMLRDQWSHHSSGIKPALAAADVAQQGWSWLKRHPLVPIAVVATVVVAKPALVWRIGRGAWIGWQAWQRYGHLVAPLVATSDDKPS